jgi:hypothetical protein
LPRFRGPPASLSTRTMDVACPVRSPCRMGDRPRPRPQAPAPPAASTDHLFHDRGHEHGARGDHGRLPGGRREFKVQRTRNALLSHRADLETTQLASPTRAQRLCKQGRGVPARPVDGPGKPLAPPGGQIPAQGEPDQPGLGLPAFGSTLPTPRASVNFRQEVWTFASGGGLLGSLDSIHVLDLPRFRGDPETGGNSLRKELTMPRSRPPYPREFREEATLAGPELGPARRGAWHRPRDPERVGEAGGAGRGAS